MPTQEERHLIKLGQHYYDYKNQLMEIRFINAYLENLYAAKPVKGKPVYSKEVILQFKKTVLRIEQADNSTQLKQFRSLNFEALKGTKKGLFSVRVNKQYRLEFKLENDKITLTEIVFIEQLSKHYE